MEVKDYCNKYGKNHKSKSTNPTHKWIELYVDIKEMRNMLLTVDFFDKFNLLEAIKVAERKQAAAYRNEDFDLKLAHVLMKDIEFMHNLLD